MTLLRKSKPKHIPHHDLWLFSVKIYKRPDIEQACLYLQNQLGANVNILLTCLWAASLCKAPLSPTQMQKLVDTTEPWNNRLTKKIRELRKLTPLLEKQFLALEIFTEKVQQSLLLDCLEFTTHSKPLSISPRQTAMENIHTYFDSVAITIDAQDSPYLVNLVSVLSDSL